MPSVVQQARGEILVVARRAHQQAERDVAPRVRTAEPRSIERRLDGDEILIRARRARAVTPDRRDGDAVSHQRVPFRQSRQPFEEEAQPTQAASDAKRPGERAAAAMNTASRDRGQQHDRA